MNRPPSPTFTIYSSSMTATQQSVKINLSQRNNSSIDSADFAKGCPYFCSEMVPFNGAYSENTSAP